MSDYHVIADAPPTYTLTAAEARKVGYGRSIPLGCGSTIVLYLVLIIGWSILLGVLESAQVVNARRWPLPVIVINFVVAIVPLPLGFIAGYLINRRWRERQLKEIEPRRNLELNEMAQLQAQRDTKRANQLLDEASRHATQLQQSLDETRSLIALAEREFNAGRTEPFWEAIENAVSCLIDFNTSVTKLSQCAGLYQTTLDGKQHNFPPFSIRPSDLPDTAEVVQRLCAIIKTAQNREHQQFADVWERRRDHQLTRGVLRQGFRTLGDAIANIGPEVARSISSLQSALSIDISEVVEEQRKTRQAIQERD
jgi:uncharacterized protein YneF (UPF0154 family)